MGNDFICVIGEQAISCSIKQTSQTSRNAYISIYMYIHTHIQDYKVKLADFYNLCFANKGKTGETE